ncbi:MAG TPA: class I SAM-dependent methyltransferase [Bryobacteraceae bacterium]|nr:class I SAM-dependent methyltransferase [Bryobacteraceae bacterium]
MARSGLRKHLRPIWAFNANNRERFVANFATTVNTGARILDAGAGTAPYRKHFSHCEYHTHDFAREPSTQGRYAPLDYVSDIANIPVSDASFDIVICTEVLEHVPRPVEAIQEFSRILRVGGILLISAPLGSLLHQEPFHFYGGYTPYWYERFLPNAGFRILRLERNMGFFSMFGQEAQRFCTLVDPRRLSVRWWWPLLALLWIATFPLFFCVLPLLGRQLDRLNLESMATVGYHLLAVKEAQVT